MIDLLFVDEVFIPVFGAPVDAIGFKKRDKMVNFAISAITKSSKISREERRARVE